VLIEETGLKQLVSCNVKQGVRFPILKNGHKCSFSLHESDYFKPASSKCGPPEAARIQHVTLAYYCVFGGETNSTTQNLHIKKKYLRNAPQACRSYRPNFRSCLTHDS